MLTNLRTKHYFHRPRVVKTFVKYVVVMTALAITLLGAFFGSSFVSAFAHGSCTQADTAYTIVGGDTLSQLATRYQTTAQQLADYNKLANLDVIYAGNVLCIPSQAAPDQGDQASQAIHMEAVSFDVGPAAVHGFNNPFPYGQCTWWASERYHQLHHVYVPWTTNANAWQWTQRAREGHWKVSSKPTVGAILNLQPFVGGAYGLGHVAVVEKILPNGHVIASNMNWAGHGSHVVNVDFAPGRGVTFITM